MNALAAAAFGRDGETRLGAKPGRAAPEEGQRPTLVDFPTQDSKTMTQYPTDEMIEAGLEAAGSRRYWLDEESLAAIYLAMRAKEQSHSPALPREEREHIGQEFDAAPPTEATGDDVDGIAMRWYVNYDWGAPHSSRESNFAVDGFKHGYRTAIATLSPNGVSQSAVERLQSAFGQPIHVDPREFLERTLAGVFCRMPDMSGDQRKRLNSKERQAVAEIAGKLLAALATQPASDTGLREALERELAELKESWFYLHKWVERGLFCKSVSPTEALEAIAFHPTAPWKNGRWDVDHKPYAAQFYAKFPKARTALETTSDDGEE